MPPRHRTRRRTRRHPQFLDLAAPEHASDVAALILRVLVDLGAWRRFVRMPDEDVLRAMGLDALAHLDTSESELLDALKAQRRSLGNRRARLSGPIATSLAALGRRLRLSRTEQALLGLFVLVDASPALRETMDLLGPQLDSASFTNICARLLHIEPARVRAALVPASPLLGSGLVRIESGSSGFTCKLTLLDGLSDALSLGHTDPEPLLSRYLVGGPAPNLTTDDFDYVREAVDHIAALIATRAAQRGCNILIHGPPGTGKTELARTIVHTNARRLLELADQGEDGSALKNADRLAAFRLAQHLLARSRDTVLLFDEAARSLSEDASPWRAEPHNLAWVHGALETARVPAIWTANTIGAIAPSILRRFDYVLELDAPPESVRRRILTRYLDGLPVGTALVRDLAARKALTPAIAQRAAATVRKLPRTGTPRTESALLRTVNGTLRAMGNSPIKRPAHPRIEYGLEFVNTTPPVDALFRDLINARAVRACFHGPPGTGKTELAREIARVSDRPLLVRRGSDILSPYIGETEHNIARAFEQAERDGAVLLLDEIDGLMFDRDGATRSWEVTQVNELLTAMETFDGTLIATTNRFDALDPASLRRFDVMAEFGWLRPEQVVELFERVSGISPALGEIRDRLLRLRSLAPGDIAAAVRQWTLAGRLRTSCALVDSIVERQRHRVERLSGIGFLYGIE